MRSGFPCLESRLIFFVFPLFFIAVQSRTTATALATRVLSALYLRWDLFSDLLPFVLAPGFPPFSSPFPHTNSEQRIKSDTFFPLTQSGDTMLMYYVHKQIRQSTWPTSWDPDSAGSQLGTWIWSSSWGQTGK